MNALLALEDGRTFKCRSFTGPGEARGEVVFNTSMTGYQEVLTDPSYSGQLVTMTYPLVGNYGINREDIESGRIQVAAFLIKEYQPFHSNHRATASLAEYLKSQDIIGVEGLDTRALTRHIRKAGAMRALLTTHDLDPASCVARARAVPGMEGQDLASTVTTGAPYRWMDAQPVPLDVAGGADALDRNVWQARERRHAVVALDFGIKYNILRCLDQAGFEVVVVPAATPAETIRAMAPNGIFLSNGPGDPEPCDYAIDAIREFLDSGIPVFGICLGHQLLALAAGAKTVKMKFGHQGANHPVQDLATGQVMITSQNHGFAVDEDSLPGNVEPTHRSLFDGTLQGNRLKDQPAFSFQGHPEASPGPHDLLPLFEDFIQDMAAQKRSLSKAVLST